MQRLIILLLTIWPLLADAGTLWRRSIANYSRHNYMAANQNWMVAQADNGWMYFANNRGLLEYDGVYWNVYPIDNNDKLRAIKITDQRIYIGALGQFGYFEADQLGRLRYTKLSAGVEKDGTLNIWNILTLGRRVYFQADGAFYYLDNGKLGKIACPSGVSYSTVVYNKLYATAKGNIYMLTGNKLQPLRNAALPPGASVIALLPFDNKMLVVTSDHGLFLYENGMLAPFHHAADALVAANKLTCAAVSGAYLALGTTQNGIILVNMRTNQTEQISTAEGLQNRNVLAVSFDRDGNLWLGLDNGIDNIMLNSPLYLLNDRFADIGAGNCASLFSGQLYMGTNQGLYAASAPLATMSSTNIRFVNGTGGQVLSLSQHDGLLFCGGRNFFMSIDTHGNVTTYPTRGVWNVCRPGHRDDALLLGDYWGLKVLRKNGSTWALSNGIQGVDISAKSMLAEEETHAVWVANKLKGLYRIVLDESLTRAVSTKNYNSDRIPKGDNICIAHVDHDIVFATRQGLFRYDMAHDRLEEHTRLEQQLEGKTAYTYIFQDQQRNIWYASDGMLRILRYDASHNTYYRNRGESYLTDELNEDFEQVCIADASHAVIGTQEGYALLRYARKQAASRPLTLKIRRIVSTNGRDSLLYGSSFSGKEPTPVVRIKHSDNSIRIEYGANNYDKAQSVLYSHRLVGASDDKWSAYGTQHVKEYTDLREGNYTFEVRIVTDDGSKPVVTSVRLRVLPPWYRAWWAWLAYIVVALACAAYVVRRIYRSHRRLNQQIETLENEKLQMELNAKQDELVRSRMNVVRKNEMLDEIKKTVVSLNNSLSEENLPSIKRKVVRLIGQIDTNIEHDDDLEAFKSDFDTVHHDFLRKLSEQYPQLTHKDRMLCAYLRMNLLSKEIAPLLNISVRGVEVSRYRLRKKLGLNEKDNLADFLQNIS